METTRKINTIISEQERAFCNLDTWACVAGVERGWRGLARAESPERDHHRWSIFRALERLSRKKSAQSVRIDLTVLKKTALVHTLGNAACMPTFSQHGLWKHWFNWERATSNYHGTSSRSVVGALDPADCTVPCYICIILQWYIFL